MNDAKIVLEQKLGTRSHKVYYLPGARIFARYQRLDLFFFYKNLEKG
jgi:hypothetical protein